jgi:hypothetical protein
MALAVVSYDGVRAYAVMRRLACRCVAALVVVVQVVQEAAADIAASAAQCPAASFPHGRIPHSNNPRSPSLGHHDRHHTTIVPEHVPAPPTPKSSTSHHRRSRSRGRCATARHATVLRRCTRLPPGLLCL